jgi:hypothetical protein
MITFTSAPTQLEADLHAIEDPLILFDNCINAAADNLNQALDTFWNLPDERLLAVMNSFGPVRVQEVFAQHAKHATAIAEMQTERGKPVRVKIGQQRVVTFNPETGLFEIPPPPVPDPPSPEGSVVTEE